MAIVSWRKGSSDCDTLGETGADDWTQEETQPLKKKGII